MRLLFLMLILSAGLGAFAQSRITGKVVNSDNEPMPGASVIIDGTTVGTLTNTKGEFTLNNLKNGDYLLKISFIGYETCTEKISLTKDIVLNIRMRKDEIMTDEVFVYATRAGAKTPVALTQISTKELNNRNLGQDVPYLLSSSPSFVSTSDAGTGVGYTGFRIRGTDANRINVTINGIPFNEAESHDVYWVDLPDFSSSVDNIQIQRGVGTSTQGAAAFGATINMQTSEFTRNAYTEVNSSAGSFNTFKNTVRAGTGLLNNHFNFDIRLSSISSDGFIDRATSNLKSYYLSGGYYSANTIVKLITFSGKEKTYQAWNGIPSVRLKSDIEGMKLYEEHGLYSHKETEAMLASNPRTYNLYSYNNQIDNYQQDHYQLLFSQRLGQNINMNAALYLTHGEGYYEEFKAGDKFSKYGLGNLIFGNDTIKKTDLVRRKWMDNNFYGGIFSINYHKGQSEITLGSGWSEYDGNHYGKIIWASYMGNVPKDYEWYRENGLKTDFNVYVKYNYTINEKINLYADVQYRNINHSLGGIDDDLRNLTQDHKYNFFNPKLGIFCQPTDKSKAYLSWSVGHREPNRSNFTDANPAGKQPTFEMLNDFEGGYSFSNSHISVGANLYMMLYKDQLILTGQINDVGAAIMTNVDKSYRAGIELMAGAQILHNLKWDINATISQNKILNFTEYVDNWDTWGQDSTYLGTTNIAFSPSIVANSTLTYEPFTRLAISLISQYVGKQYVDNSSSNNRVIDPYFVNNLKVSYSITPRFIKEIQFQLLVSNLLNEQYETNAWVYSYIYRGSRYKQDGYFPQAGTNFLFGVNLKF